MRSCIAVTALPWLATLFSPSAVAADLPPLFDGAICPAGLCAVDPVDYRVTCDFLAYGATRVNAWVLDDFEDGHYSAGHTHVFGVMETPTGDEVFRCEDYYLYASGHPTRVEVIGTDGDDVIALTWHGASENYHAATVLPLTQVWVWGGEGDDVLHGSWNDEDNLLQVFYGEQGHDRILLRSYDNPDNAGDCDCTSAFDPASPPSCGVYAFGGEGNDFIDGRPIDDCRLDGGGGRDVILTHDGDDHARGGDGVDILRSAWGKDVLRGGDGTDVLVGGPGRDVMCAGGNGAFLSGDDEAGVNVRDELWGTGSFLTPLSGVSDTNDHCADIPALGMWAKPPCTYDLTFPPLGCL